jgi:hypothetical protein
MKATFALFTATVASAAVIKRQSQGDGYDRSATIETDLDADHVLADLMVRSLSPRMTPSPDTPSMPQLQVQTPQCQS